MAALGCGHPAKSPVLLAGAAPVVAPPKSALELMPKDADMVMGIDFARIRSSELFQKYEPQMMALAGDKLARFKDVCGWDPIPKLATATIAIRGERDDQDVTGLITGFTRAELLDCLTKAAEKARAAGKPAALTVDGDFVHLDGGKEPVSFLFVGDGILIARRHGGEGTAGKDVLVALTHQPAAASLVGSPAFMDAHGKTRTTDALWFVVNGAAPALKQMPVAVDLAFGSLDVDAQLSLDATGRMPNAADVQAAGAKASETLTQFKAFGLVQEAAADVRGNDVHVKVVMTQAQIEKLVQMAGSMLGGRMSGNAPPSNGVP
ncbi:MAG: hypothetical protein K8W52_10735 [Deltaproteobacteria bacterium]|nr:hypothetical protein [Deltaproteobacteria bacterium]